MGPRYYYLGPWVWVADEDGPRWQPPAGTLAAVDLRPPERPNEGYGFFVTRQSLDDPAYTLFGDSPHAKLTDAQRRQWASLLGLDAIDAATVLDAAWDTLTIHSDPDGVRGPRPLIPRQNRMLELHLGDQGPARARLFRGEKDPAWPKIQRALHNDYRTLRAQAQGGKDKTLHRRVLGDWQRKYQIKAEEFIPADLPPETPLPPHTSYSDDFNRADGSPGADWTSVAGSWIIETNEIRSNNGGSPNNAFARHEPNLSSADHWAQITYTWGYSATYSFLFPRVRVAPASQTSYYISQYAGGAYGDRGMSVGKVINTVPTSISGALESLYRQPPPSRVIRLEVDGSALTVYEDGSPVYTGTDTAIGGFTRTGLIAHSNTTYDSKGEDFSCADLTPSDDPTPPGTGNQFQNDANCVAWWRLDSPAGRQFLWDDSGSGNHLLQEGGALDTTDPHEGNGCAVFVGASYQYLRIQDEDLSADFPFKGGGSGNNKISASCWFKLNSLGVPQTLVSKFAATSAPSLRSWLFCVGSTNKPTFQFSRDGTSGTVQTLVLDYALTTGVWYRGTVTYDDATGACYLRLLDTSDASVHTNSGTLTTGVYVCSTSVTLGCSVEGSSTTWDYPLDGYLDEVLVFKDILGDAEIAAIEAGTYGAVPSKATNPDPADTATGVALDADLSWSNGGGATSYDVYWGTSAESLTRVSEGQAGTTYDPGALGGLTTYYWRIDTLNGGVTTTGDVWSFTTQTALPGAATNPTPADAAADVAATTDLSWDAGSGAATYDVYFGASPGSLVLISEDQAGTACDPGTLGYLTTYYWRVDSVNAGGTTTGTVWSFTTGGTAPALAINPSPANTATNVALTTALSWEEGGGALPATSYDVYWGTSAESLTRVSEGQAGTTYDPGTLDYDTTYYWRVDAINAYGTTTGTVWSFTTAAYTVPTRIMLPPPWRPEQPIIEVLEWYTEILTATDGTQQRIARRRVPRQSFQFSFVLADEVAAAQLDAYLDWGLKRQWAIPIWPEMVEHTATLAAGVTTISLETRYADWRDGSLGLVWQDNQYEIFELDSHTATDLTVSAGLANTYTGSKLIMPLRVGFVAGPVQKRMHPTGVTLAEILLRVTDNVAVTGYVAAATYDGLEVLTTAAYIESTQDEQHEGDLIVCDAGTGVILYASDSRWNLRRQSHVFYHDTPAACWTFRQWLHALKGPQARFLVPTFRHDLTLTREVGTTDTDIYVSNIGLTGDETVRRPYLGFVKNGVLTTRKINAVSPQSLSEEKITLDASVGGAGPMPVGTQVCFVDGCCLAADRVQIVWERAGVNSCKVSLARVSA